MVSRRTVAHFLTPAIPQTKTVIVVVYCYYDIVRKSSMVLWLCLTDIVNSLISNIDF